MTKNPVVPTLTKGDDGKFHVDRNFLCSFLAQHGFLLPADFSDAIQGGDILLSVIAAYQSWHGLRPDGQAGPETAKSITTPRFCKHPDVMKMDARLASWPYREVSWYAPPGLRFGQLSADDTHAALEWGWLQWHLRCGLNPSYNTNPRTADVAVTAGSVDGSFGTLAWSELPDGSPGPARGGPQRNQKFDEAEPWVNSATPTQFQIDAARVACHEIGHAIGIGHINTGNLMAPMYSQVIRVPQQGDIAEAMSRYGPPVVVDPPPPPPPPSPGRIIVQLELSGSVLNAIIPGFSVTPLK